MWDNSKSVKTACTVPARDLPMNDSHFALKKQFYEFDVPWWLISPPYGHWKAWGAGVGTIVPLYNETERRENSSGMGRSGERKTSRGETRGLDILSINIWYPQHPFVSLTPFFSNLISIRDTWARQKEKEEGAGGLLHMHVWRTIISTFRLKKKWGSRMAFLPSWTIEMTCWIRRHLSFKVVYFSHREKCTLKGTGWARQQH